MKLPIPFLGSKGDDSSYYLALVLTDEKVSAVILHEEFNRIKLVNSHEEFFHVTLDNLSQEELITAVDRAISKAEEILPPNIETHKTVFGVKDTWVDPETKKIKKEYLTELKKVCDSLDLTPIGFMVTTEAIANLLQQQEGAPLSATFAEIGHKTVSLTLLRAGKPIESMQGPLGESSAETVDKLLRHFTIAVLPARIIVFNSKANEKLSQQFISHQWSKDLPFLHMPQITVLPTGFDAKAVTFGAATQLGFEFPYEAHIAAAHTSHHVQQVIETEEPKEEPQHEEASIEEPDDPPLSGDNFGFVAGHDIASVPAHAEKEPLHPKHEAAVHHPTHKMHDSTHTNHPTHHAEPVHHVQHHQLHHETDDAHEPRLHESKKTSFMAALPAFKLPKMNAGVSSLAKNKFVLIGIGALVLLLVLIAGISYYYLNNVTTAIKLTLSPKVASQTSEVTFSATSPSDFSENIIAGKDITTTVNGELSINATGKKDVGEKAKGKVTIYNNSDESIQLSSGTILKSSNGLQFLLDKDVSVSSASGDIFSGTKPGTADGSVIAKEFGSEYNFPSNTKFAIGGNSLIAAKNDGAFSGGSKKSVTVVSKEDIAKLRADLPQTLEDQGVEELKKAADSGETVLPILLGTTLSKEKFDKKIDDEAKKVKLTATVQFSGMAYSNDELNQYAKSLLKKDQAENVNVADDSVKNTVEDAKKKGKKDVEATVMLEAGLLPNIDTSQVTKDVEGKSLREAKEILERLPQLENSVITFSPNIPLLPNMFPTLPKNITVEVTSNE